MDVEFDTRKQRVIERGHEVAPVLLETSFVDRTRAFLEIVGPSVSYKKIDTTNLNTEDILSQAMSFIEGCNKASDIQLSKFSVAIAPFIRKSFPNVAPKFQ